KRSASRCRPFIHAIEGHHPKVADAVSEACGAPQKSPMSHQEKKMTVVCIAGMHRSGTSMIAQLLNLCGLYLGEEKDLMLKAADNPEGFWENLHFVDINEKILDALQGGWDIPPAVTPSWESSALFDQFRHEAAQLIKAMENHTPWGWKDPCNSLTLPF